MTPALLLSWLLAVPPVDASLLGAHLGDKPERVQAQFKPRGEPKGAKWAKEDVGGVSTLTYRCRVEDRCFSVPAEADFFFVDKRLASATFYARADAAPANAPLLGILAELEAEAKLGEPAARAQAVGRRTRFFTRPKHTVVWTQDGEDAEVRLYLDALHPLGRAEAWAQGAPVKLDALPGASAYGAAHQAILAGNFDTAVRALERLLAEKGVSILLKRDAELLFAMALAARAKNRPANEKLDIKADLSRALKHAPELKADLEALAAALGVGALEVP